MSLRKCVYRSGKVSTERANRAVPVALASCDNIEAAQVRVINVCHQVIYQPLIL